MRRVTVAMSGGVDSSVAAFVLCRGGDDCVGATMKLFDNGDVGIPRDQTCAPYADGSGSIISYSISPTRSDAT